ncbi:MAG: hypothetical protein N2517_05725 [Ignavibacteria bacterium]|nr:hypothetical protein [Ignavibacteria bacterium]
MNVAGIGSERVVTLFPHYSDTEDRVVSSANRTDSVELFKKRFPFDKKEESPKNSKISKVYGKELSPEEEKRVEELKKIESKVKAHEMAHIAAGGGLVRGGATYTYEVGPDGKRYIVGGEVKIDMSVDPENPEATIQKMQQVQRAALAPVDPSPQDRSVAQQASNIEAQMRMKLLQEKAKGLKGNYKSYNSNDISRYFQVNNDKDVGQTDLIINASSVGSLKRKLDILI